MTVFRQNPFLPKIFFTVLVFAATFFTQQAWGQSYLGLDGGFEGTATIDNSTTYTVAQSGKWSKNNSSTTIANETGTVRSGSNALRIQNTSNTGRRVYTPNIAVSTTSRVVVQYYRRVANTTHQEAQQGINRNTTESLSGTYANGTANTWEKVTYAPTGITNTTNTNNALWGVVMTRVPSGGTAGDMFIDDLCIYVASSVDETAPNSPSGSVTVSNATTTSLDVSWGAASGGVDGGGYMVVRYATSPNADNDPNQNGIYAVGNTTTNGTGSLTGTIVYIGTGTSLTDDDNGNNLTSGTTYYYKVYTFDKAYNYSAETSGNGATTSSGSTPPSLTAAGSATVDAAFDVTFTDDATWRSAITSITVGGTTLTAGYNVSSGTITFTPSASSPSGLLQTSGTKSIVVKATGYTDATVSQTIGAGAPAKLGITTQPIGHATVNNTTLATQPVVVLQDQYGNTTNATNTTTIDATAVEGTWTLGGTKSININIGNSTATFTNLTTTNTSGSTISNNATISFTAMGLTDITSNAFSIPILYAEPLTTPTPGADRNVGSPTSSIDVSWTPVTADGYLVVRRAGGNQPEAPSDGTNYSVGGTVGSNSIVAYKGTGNDFTDIGLSAGTEYSYRVYTYNGSGVGTYNYKTTSVSTASAYTLSTPPATQASFTSFENITASGFKINFSGSGGTGRLVLVKQGSAVDAAPIGGTVYTANASFGNGTQIGTGNYVVYSNTGTSVTVSNLTPNTVYHVAVFEYSGSTNTRNFNTEIEAGNIGSRTTLVTQPSPVTALAITTTTHNSISLSWTNGNGDGRIVVARLSTTNQVGATDGTDYAFSSNSFTDAGNGTTGTGNIVVYKGTGNSVTITNLNPATSYSFYMYEYNGSGDVINYSSSLTLPFQYTLTTEPTAHAASFIATAISAAHIILTFSAANTLPATGYLLLRKSSAFVAGDYPADGTAYSTGADVGPNGAKVVMFDPYHDILTNTAYTTTADQTWYFLLIPFNWDGGIAATINYYTGGSIPTANATTTSGASDVVAVASSSPASISSLINDAAPLTSSTGIQVWQVTIRDGGASMNDADLLPTKVSAIRFTAGSGNAVTWNTAVKTAALFDGATLLATATISGNSFIFSGLNIEVADNDSVILSLRISLNETLGAGNDDGDDFQFQLSQSNITAVNDGTSSGFASFTSINTINNAENVIDVVATKLMFVQQPSNVVISTIMTPSVTVQGTDVNGNVDLGFTGDVAITANGTSVLSGSPVTKTAIAGIATFNNIQFTNAGINNTLTAASTGFTDITSDEFDVVLAVETLAQWTFETTVPTTAGPHAAEIGTGDATNPHSSGSVAYSNPVGNGSTESFSSNNWSAGDYYQFTTSTNGYENITLSFDQTGSGTGPKDFKVQYSTDGSSFTDLGGGGYALTNDNWSSSGSPKPESNYSFDLSSVTVLNNQTSIYIRIVQVGTSSIGGGAVASGGTNRVDNVTIQGFPMTFTWTGSGDGSNWSDAANWDCNCGKTPSSNNIVVIPNSSNVILDTDFTANQMTLNATSTLKIAPTKTLTVAGYVNFNAQSVTVQSTASGTGSIGKVIGILEGASNVTVERYISASGNRAYRMLTPTVNTTTSIKDNWMEGVNNVDVATNSNPNAGYGTHITGVGGASNGFDPTQNNQASLFNLIGNAWVAATNTSSTLNATTGYLLFVRGSRDNINTINTTTGSSNTTLRATGTLLTGTQTFSNLAADEFHFVTNPYASAIDWGSIYSNNSANFTKFAYIWDPNIGTRGGYVSVENNGTVSPSSDLNQYIQSGQAFFVKTLSDVNNTLTITENDKPIGENNIDAFRNASLVEKLGISLRFTANSKDVLADGVLARFANTYNNTVDENDATQIANWDEDVSLLRESKKLSIESRSAINNTDTLFVQIANLRAAQSSYRWVITPQNFESFRLQAFLEDNYTGLSSAISLSDTTIIPFTVNGNAASTAANRFKIVFVERQAFYSKANNLSANDLNSWSSTNDGSGISPTSFDIPALFVVQQGHTLHLNSHLDIPNGYVQIEQNAAINNIGTLSISHDIDNNGSIIGTGITELNGTTKQIISGVGSISNLSLNNISGATITQESKVSVLESYQPTAGILTTNNNLVLVSNEITTASITTGAASGNYLRGNVIVERFIPAKATRKWSFVASAVTQSIAQSWQQQIHITGAGNGGSVCPELAPNNNGFDATVTNTPSMYSYDASQTSGQRWIALNNTLTENLTAGKAFRVNIRGDRNLGCSLLDGTVNTVSAVTLQATGLINIENHNAGNFNISYPNTLADNYVFIGNPYPSAINFNTFRTDNSANIANNYAIYIPTNNAGVYTYWDANTQTFTGGTGYDDITGNEIVSGQAFFVQAKNIGNVTLTFTEEQKVNAHNTGYFKPKNYPEQIKINYLQNNIKVDEAIIRFVDDENISNTLFNSLDIPSMNSGTYISSLKDTKGMVVQTRNLTTLKQDEVWLNIGATASGTYQLNFSNFDNFANTDIYLTDHYTNTTQNIRENAVYEFSIDKDNVATKGVARFSISFNRTIQPEYVSNVIKLYPNPANKQVTIELPQTVDNNITYNIKVTDLAGKIIIQKRATDKTEKLNVNRLTAGTYIVEVIDNKGNRMVEKLVKE
ncbi:MAG: T9SS type A sorting domain-containing protein [Chitinophagaceae bacterium]|nr:T9SS type A sorting domain-containing protein [Chitinophagaceae bacterium]MCW5904748.1 T9SS type A sorting domain-containing protein [Chitinophagaceae bacterium]